MQTIDEAAAELVRLRAIEREYTITARALAVTVGRLLEFTGGDTVEISDQAIQHAPDLRAWRNHRINTVEITVERDNGNAPGPQKSIKQARTAPR